MNSNDSTLLEGNLKAWNKKSELQKSYERYFNFILSHCEKHHAILEMGAGFGAFSHYAREKGFSRWLTSDVLQTRYVNLVSDADALPLRSACVDRVVFVDVLHHLAFPMKMFLEAERVLVPCGEIVCVEPWISVFSWFVYHFFHHEGADMRRDPEAPFGMDEKDAYEGCTALATLIVKKVSSERWAAMGFNSPQFYPFNDFSYALTGGFSRRSLCPPRMIEMIRRFVDERFKFIQPFAAMRALMVWKKV